MQDTAGEARTNSLVTFSYGPLRMDVSVLADQQELTYNNCVDQGWGLEDVSGAIGTKRESGKSVLAVRVDDDHIRINAMLFSLIERYGSR